MDSVEEQWINKQKEIKDKIDKAKKIQYELEKALFTNECYGLLVDCVELELDNLAEELNELHSICESINIQDFSKTKLA